jgi:hypothetical protein
VTTADEWGELYTNPMFDPEPPAGPHCERDGINIDTYGGEREWQCGRPGTVRVPSGRLMCEDHAGELGYGPKQEEYGFDPNDGLNPTDQQTEAT